VQSISPEGGVLGISEQTIAQTVLTTWWAQPDRARALDRPKDRQL